MFNIYFIYNILILGFSRYESCWPAFRNNTQGVIFVCSSSNAANATREFDLLYNYFVLQPGLTPKQCLVLYHTSEIQQDIKGLRLCQCPQKFHNINTNYYDWYGYSFLKFSASTFGKISQVPANISDGGNKLRSDFSNYLVSVINSSNWKVLTI